MGDYAWEPKEVSIYRGDQVKAPGRWETFRFEEERDSSCEKKCKPTQSQKEYSHAGTSIAHDRDFSKRKLSRDGTADPRRGSASHASSHETSHQALGGATPGLPALWANAVPTGRNGTPGDRYLFRAGGSAAPALSLSGVWIQELPSQP